MNSGARPPGMTTRGEVGRIHVREGDVDGTGPTGLLDVGVEVGLEVVDDELDRPRRRRRDVRLVTRLDEPVLHEHRLEVLGRVTGEDQHLRHRSSSVAASIVLPLTRRAAAGSG